MSQNDTAPTTDVQSPTERLNAVTLNERPEEFVNRLLGERCGRHAGKSDVETCGRDVRTNQFVRIETRQRLKPSLMDQPEHRIERLEAEGIQTREWVREYVPEREHHCPVHGLNVATL